MPFELDHLFVCSSPGGEEAEALIRFGLTEGAANRHPGQGTANRRFFFANAFLELLWVEDAVEAQSALVRRTGLWERWSKRCRDASPFGVCLRPAGQRTVEPPWAAWQYHPPYLAPDLAIQMAANSDDYRLPLLFAISFGRRPDADEPARRQPLAHPAGLRSITGVRLGIAGIDAEELTVLKATERACPPISLVSADEHWLEIGFDDETQAGYHDFRPNLPLVFRW